MTQVDQNQIRIYRTREEIESLRGFWNACRPSRDADLDFFLFIVDLFPQTERPHVVVLYDGDAPKALLAGRLDLSSLPIRLGYFTLPVPKMRILQFVHGGWLGDISEAVAKVLIDSVIETLAAGEADAAFLHCPNVASPLVHWAARLPHRFCSDHLVESQIHRVHKLPRTKDAFWASLSGKQRSNLRRRTRRMEEDFRDHTIELLTTSDDVERLAREAEAIAKTSYQRGLGVGFRDSTIIRARLDFEARKGWLRGYILYLDEHPSAFWIGSLRNQTFLGDYVGFDPHYAQYGPGIFLMTRIMDELSRTRCNGLSTVECIDFGIGDAQYKKALANDHWEESPVYIFAPSLKGVGVNALRSAVGLLNRLAKAFLGMTSVLEWLKRSWRARAAHSTRL